MQASVVMSSSCLHAFQIQEFQPNPENSERILLDFQATAVSTSHKNLKFCTAVRLHCGYILKIISPVYHHCRYLCRYLQVQVTGGEPLLVPTTHPHTSNSPPAQCWYGLRTFKRMSYGFLSHPLLPLSVRLYPS